MIKKKYFTPLKLQSSQKNATFGVLGGFFLKKRHPPDMGKRIFQYHVSLF